MNELRLMQLLLAPHVSEKSTRIADAHRQVAFRVMGTARKPEIKRAVERLFNVEVQRVHVINMKGKRKTFAKRPGRRPDWKKAYVTLKPGHDINFLGGD
ncbi:MAG: 50S ribosomal protein L23 [Gammaproteobacteria bacterium]